MLLGSKLLWAAIICLQARFWQCVTRQPLH
jgi:hypothetical protein